MSTAELAHGPVELLGPLELARVSGSGLVPRDDLKLVGKSRQLWPPRAAVLSGTVHEHERGPVAHPRVG
jgi:hypothetical protein